MSELTFRFDNGKVHLVKGDNKKELPRDSLLEVCQLILGHLVDNRDYTSVTSVNKLLRIIDLECEPDESDNEVQEESKPVAKPVPRKAPVRRQAPAKKPVVEEDSDDDSDE